MFLTVRLNFFIQVTQSNSRLPARNYPVKPLRLSRKVTYNIEFILVAFFAQVQFEPACQRNIASQETTSLLSVRNMYVEIHFHTIYGF